MYNLTPNKIAEYVFMILYLTFLVLMAFTEKDNRKIEKSVSVYGIVISIGYIVYLCIVQEPDIYRYAIYAIYLIFYILLLLLDTITLKKYARDSYTNGILLTLVTMTIFTQELVTASSIIYVLLIIFFYMVLNKIRMHTKKYRSKIVKKEINKTLPIGFFLGVANFVMFTAILTFEKLML